ncbi:hypothetical protein [Spongiibacter tropicus]|uniref:hypothetical protein n=1 Tax=Spongiibacter tropicus TaxID=454602 RepID=UPI0035BE1928
MLDLIAEGMALRNNPPILPGAVNPQLSAKIRSRPQTAEIQPSPRNPGLSEGNHYKIRKSAKSATPPVFELSIEAFNRDGIEITPDDLAFLRQRLPLTPVKRDALLAQYRETWQQAMQNENAPHRKQNKGRFAANTWLRNQKN